MDIIIDGVQFRWRQFCTSIFYFVYEKKRMEGFERIQFDGKNDTCFSALYCIFFF